VGEYSAYEREAYLLQLMITWRVLVAQFGNYQRLIRRVDETILLDFVASNILGNLVLTRLRAVNFHPK